MRHCRNRPSPDISLAALWNILILGQPALQQKRATLSAPAPTLTDFGWRPFFAEQLAPDDALGDVLRITAVQRASATGMGEAGEVALIFPPDISAGDVAVGDWAIREPDSHRIARLLDRESTLSRRAAGAEAKLQLIAANVDTLFITSSCNPDFNPARLERYLALALDAGVTPVIVLTKTDESDDVDSYVAKARGLSDKLADVIALNAKDPDQLAPLRAWCGTGQTVAFIGSSGVGKSTLINGLSGGQQITQNMRADDAKGRHTTTSRSLHLLPTGGLLMDMPGMRELAMLDVAHGIDVLFDDIATLAQSCKFNDCAHASEPGCAITAALADGTLDPARLARWTKLKAEDAQNTQSLSVSRKKAKDMVQIHKTAKNIKRGRQK